MISDHTTQKITFNIVIDNFTNDFCNKVENADWSKFYKLAEHQINEQWKTFANIFLFYYNQTFPLKILKQRTNRMYNMNESEIKKFNNRLD